MRLISRRCFPYYITNWWHIKRGKERGLRREGQKKCDGTNPFYHLAQTNRNEKEIRNPIN